MGVEALDPGDGLDPAPLAPAADEDDEVDRLGDQPARHRDHGLLDELLQSVERRMGRVGVDRGDAAGMTRVPGLQHVEGLGSPDLADDDAVGPKAHGRAYEIGEADDARLGAQRYAVDRKSVV